MSGKWNDWFIVQSQRAGPIKKLHFSPPFPPFPGWFICDRSRGKKVVEVWPADFSACEAAGKPALRNK
jgi:hypothetical protein